MRRLRAVIVLIGALAVLAAARSLDPQELEAGRGRVLSYRLRRCGFLYSTGYPCPACYMTRSVAHVTRGHVLKAFYAQPFGAALARGGICFTYVAAVLAISGERWRPVGDGKIETGRVKWRPNNPVF